VTVPHVSSGAAGTPTGAVRIWDLPVRLFHWLLVLSVAAAAVSGWLLPVNWLSLHLLAGTAIAVLLPLRLVWGLAGSAYSRFSSFDIRPAAVIAHVRNFGARDPQREAGHNPLGAWMVIAMLVTLATIVTTGALLLGGGFKQGPFKSLVSFATAWDLRDVHEVFAFGLLGLVALHVGGVVFESRRTGENLAAAMVTGRKRPGFAHPLRVVAARPVLALVAGGALLAAGVAVAMTLAARPPWGVPQMAANVAWARECAACHIAFHPSLLPAKSWSEIMDRLDDHFGEDASLDAVATTEIKSFLIANAAEAWDTLPANRLRLVDEKRPLEITATPFWTRLHGDIPEGTFKAKPVGARQNCAACHSDAATGLFAPQNIAIPKE
jgi:cytochrome b